MTTSAPVFWVLVQIAGGIIAIALALLVALAVIAWFLGKARSGIPTGPRGAR